MKSSQKVKEKNWEVENLKCEGLMWLFLGMARGSQELGKVRGEASGGWFGGGIWWRCGRGLEGRRKGAVLDIVYSTPSFLRRYKRWFRPLFLNQRNTGYKSVRLLATAL